jgi:hypothetical protein
MSAAIGIIFAILAIWLLIKAVGLLLKIVAVVILIGVLIAGYLWLQKRISGR